MVRIAIIIALMTAAPASAQTLTCSETFQGYRVCQKPDGYRSTETQWQGMTIGDDNRATGGREANGRGGRLIIVTPRQER
jgi:hypothetical protein